MSHWLLTLGIFVHHVFGKMVNGQSGPEQEKGNLNLIRLVLLSRLVVFSLCIFAQ